KELVFSNPTGGYDWDETYELDPSGITAAAAATAINGLQLAVTAQAKDTYKLRVYNKLLGFKGDSGSVWVDDAGMAVGLLYSVIGITFNVKLYGAFRSVGFGRPVACYLKPVFDAMTLPWPAAISPATVPSHGPIAQTAPIPWPAPEVMRDFELAIQ